MKKLFPFLKPYRGAIVESGTHRELLGKKGFYWKLYNSQES